MDLKQIAPGYYVAPQIEAGDLPAIADAGITRIICNRPDAENPPELQAAAIEAAARGAGLDFAAVPMTNESLTLDDVARHAELIEQANGPVLAYCRSGTRSTIIWAMGQAGKMPTDEIVAAGARGGYDLSGLRPTLDKLAEQAG
ncbi:TIGR01244 family sulfur transferase [Salipiger mucosus]|uniref:Sulfide-quinone reductase n=1 Tax=Salipiger mucosus DSM 16094 TaxID=1123237 RepID=S9R126_9RHOB|nr:TIGR01244 family sulfur transferase [Salipiger mucosus]EPX85623.1 Sulfide-quinone reductase [Salipiger mucosus DSM 16094]